MWTRLLQNIKVLLLHSHLTVQLKNLSFLNSSQGQGIPSHNGLFTSPTSHGSLVISRTLLSGKRGSVMGHLLPLPEKVILGPSDLTERPWLTKLQISVGGQLLWFSVFLAKHSCKLSG